MYHYKKNVIKSKSQQYDHINKTLLSASLELCHLLENFFYFSKFLFVLRNKILFKNLNIKTVFSIYFFYKNIVHLCTYVKIS